MRGVEAAREGNGHADGADALDFLADGLADRVQNDEAAVAEDRNRDDPAHEHHRELRVLLTDAADDDIGQPDGGARALKDQANQGAEDDDDTDARERAREAGADDARDLGERQAHDDGQQERRTHQRKERMDFPFGNRNNH